MAAPSYNELKQLGESEAISLRPDLFINTGDITDFLLAAAAAMADKNIQFAVEEFAKTFVDTADGDDLTTLANDHYDIQRDPATAASVTVEFTRPFDAGAEPAGTITAGTEIATTVDASGNDVRFVTDIDLVFGLGVLGPLSVVCTAVDTGTSGNIDTGEVSRIIDSIGFDGTFTVDNPSVVGAGGNDEENDSELRDKIRNRPLTFRRATLAALEFGALQVPAVRVATATEDPVTADVTVAVSDSGGNSNAQMIGDTITELENWRAAGVNVNVLGSSVLAVNVTVTLTLAPGGVAAVLITPITDAITETINQLAIGQTLYNTMITTAVRNVDPDNILDVNVVMAGEDANGDVVPSTNQLIRTGVVSVS